MNPTNLIFSASKMHLLSLTNRLNLRSFCRTNQMCCICALTVSEYTIILSRYAYKFVHILAQCQINIDLKIRESIHQFKRYDAILKMTVSTFERSFSLIAGTNTQRIVGGYDIQLCIPFFSFKKIKKGLHQW